MNADKTLNDILVKLFNDLMEIEEKCLISGEFMNISGNDMHIIEAIGLDEPKRMSEVAARMNVTTGLSPRCRTRSTFREQRFIFSMRSKWVRNTASAMNGTLQTRPFTSRTCSTRSCWPVIRSAGCSW